MLIPLTLTTDLWIQAGGCYLERPCTDERTLRYQFYSFQQLMSRTTSIQIIRQDASVAFGRARCTYHKFPMAALRRFLYLSGFSVGITDREFLDSLFGLSGSIAGLRCRLGSVSWKRWAIGWPGRSTGEPLPGPVYRCSGVPRIGVYF